MKSYISLILILAFFAFESSAVPTSPDRDKYPSFDKTKDLLVFQFDNRPDPDDIHSQAAVGSMIRHSDFDGVNTYAVLGATGTQKQEILNSTTLMEIIFGPEGSDTWTDARSFYEQEGKPNQQWITSVERVKDMAKPILLEGGNVWVMEAGQSHITRDWIEALQADGVSQDICRERVFIVQHSGWNHRHNRQEDLDFLVENSKYIRIDDGNHDPNDPGEEDNDTPDFQSDSAEVKVHKELRSAARTEANPNAATRAIWKEAGRIIEELNFHAKWSPIAKGALDFSDTAELWWIMDLGDRVKTLPDFWDRYVMPSKAKYFYISPQGSDDNPGTKEQPFATLAHARDQVQLWNQSNATEDIMIWLNGGEYRLSETLVFGLEHSARHGQKITWSALPGEVPVINSDVTISGWKKVGKSPEGLPRAAKGKLWVAPVPESARGLKTVYNSRGMLPRARTSVFKHQRESSEGRGQEDVYKTIPFEQGTTDKLFTPGNAEIVVVPDRPWTMCILPVESVDHETGMVTLGANSTYGLAAPRWYMEPEVIWVENSFAGLDEPGEWVYDDEKNLLYYWPQEDKKPGDDIVVPQLIEMIRVEGDIDYEGPEDSPVQGLYFKGITFTHGDRYESFGRTGSGIQHDWERFDESTALVRFRGAEYCGVEDCIFIHSGGTGIRLDLHAQNISIINNELSELGGGGVLLAGYGPGTKDVNTHNEVSNNYIHHIGRLWWHAFGVWAWQSGHNLISHNTIHDVPYSAILVTGRIRWDRSGIGECSQTVRWHETGKFTGNEIWEERERFMHGRHNIIENNDMHHVMTVMHDGNGVYISGAGTGNIVRGNFVHDTPSMAAGEAIRCDNDQNETLIENNVVYRFGTHGIGLCSKGRNHIFNNIVACPPHRVNRGMLNLEPTSKMGMAGSIIIKNIFYANQANQPFMFRRQGAEFRNGMEYILGTFVVDKNIYFNSSDPNAADDYLEWAREHGHETGSIKDDPLFMDIENGDFRLKPDSPALKLGFRPFVLDAGRKTK